jgi:ubiquinone/menaquinone biosynthesis C-methylase UbiE
MNDKEDPKKKAAATYNAASDTYDDPANTFWDRFGRKTVERLGLKRGTRVLDVCCGAGASAIPAAEMVGHKGRVLGIDLAENLLALARAKAEARGLANIEFRIGDMLDPEIPESPFDVVVCVFGIFFVPDMLAAVQSLWSDVAEGGKLAITTWGPRFFEPATTAFWESIRAVRPELYKGFNPWDRISDEASLRQLLSAAGATDIEIQAERNTHPIASPEAWWAGVLGTGYRGTIDQLSKEHREEVRTANFKYIEQSGITEVEANVVYAIARKH